MKATLLAAVILIGSAAPGFADRPPTPDERAQIERVLRAEGFQSWGEIELDDGRWEVDDARASDGRKHDIKIDPRTMRIVERDAD